MENIVGVVDIEGEKKAFELDTTKYILKLYEDDEMSIGKTKIDTIFHINKIKYNNGNSFIKRKVLNGITTNENKIILEVLDYPRYDQTQYYSVNYYCLLDANVELKDITKVILTGDDIDYFLPPRDNAFTFDTRKQNVSLKSIEYNDCGMIGNKKKNVNFKTYSSASIVFNSQKPISSNSFISIEYNGKYEDDAKIGYINSTMKALCYLKDELQPKISSIILVYGNDAVGNIFFKTLTNKTNEKINIINYSLIGDKFANLVSDIYIRNIDASHLRNKDEKHHYNFKTIFSILSEFEGEFNSIYGRKINPDEYFLIRDDIVEVIKSYKKDKVSGPKNKKHVQDIINNLKKFEPFYSYENMVQKVMKENLHLLNKIYSNRITQNYIENMPTELNIIRNDIAHCKKNKRTEAMHINYYKILEVLIYAMRLKTYDLDEDKLIKCLSIIAYNNNY